MWMKSKSNIDFVDSKIVKRDFIIAEGYTLNYSFLDGENNPFGRRIYAPTFYLFKVHRNHPLRIFNSSLGFSAIWPANEIRRKGKKFRMPAEVVKDRMDYDLSTFLLVPFEINLEKRFWKKFVVPNSFSSSEKSSLLENIRNEKQDTSLLYAEHGIDIHCQDYFHRLSEVMPSQVIKHFYHWLTDEKEITSHKDTFDKNLEGKILVNSGIARRTTAEIFNILENRYKTRLLFDDYKRDFPDIFSNH